MDRAWTARVPGLALLVVALGVGCSTDLVVGREGEPATPPPAGVQTTLFPLTAPWYQDVSRAPADAESSRIIAGVEAKGGWGSASLQIEFSLHVLHAEADVPRRVFARDATDFWEPDCDFAAVPLPPGGRLEGERDYACRSDGLCRLLVIQGTRLYEQYRVNVSAGVDLGVPYLGGCLVVWDLTRDYWKPAPRPTFGRGDQCTSADGAGLPIAPLTFSADEVKSGAVNHALRFALPRSRVRLGEYVRPANHCGVRDGTPSSDLLPFGARLRLRPDYDVQALPSPGARVLARTLQRYGMFLTEKGNVTLIMAQSDALTTAKWTGLLAARDLASLKVGDFEVVEAGPRIPSSLTCSRTPP